LDSSAFLRRGRYLVVSLVLPSPIGYDKNRFPPQPSPKHSKSTISTMADYTHLTKIAINFENPILNKDFADTIPVDTIVQDSTMIHPDCLTRLHNAICDIIQDLALDGSDSKRIKPLVEKMLFKTIYDGSTTRLRTSAIFATIIQELLVNKDTKFTVLVNTHAIILMDDFHGTNIDSLQYDTQVPVNARRATATATATSPLTYSNPVLPNTVSTKVEPFDIHKLPTTVQERFHDYQDSTKLTPVTQMTAFPDGMLGPTVLNQYYMYQNRYLIGSCIILRNGGLLEGQVNDKKFHRDALKFTTSKTVTPTTLRIWYRDFHRHCLACGIYTIPCELFINGYGGSKGFDYGTDLPAAFEATQNQ
jgi:hypothetical protein